MIEYLKRRLEERITWAAIAMAITAAAAVAEPWCYYLLAAGIIGVFAPSPGRRDA